MTNPNNLHDAWLLPCVHPVYVRLLCAEVRRRGLDDKNICDDGNEAWRDIHETDAFLTFAQLRPIILRALDLSECPWLGLVVGSNTQLSIHGALGYASMASANTIQVLELIQRFIGLRQRIAFFDLAPEAAPVTLVLREAMMAPEVREYLSSNITAAFLTLMETVTGRDLKRQTKISWPFARPAWAHVYEAFSPNPEFSATQLSIQLPADFFSYASMGADAKAYQSALRDCENQLSLQLSGSLSTRIHQRLLECQGEYPSLEAIALSEKVSTRTLIRHLQKEGVNYQMLLDQVRKESASWMLISTSMTVEQIAMRLGYLDTSNFSRTFRRWFGINPREFKQTKQT